MIFHRSLSKKKGAAYSFFSGISAGIVPAIALLLLHTLTMAIIPLIQFINTDFGSTVIKSKDKYDYLIFGLDDTASIYVVLALAGILSIFVAVRLFSFICDKKTVNVFYSLGIKRSTLFMSKYLAGAVLLIAATIIPVILSYAVNLIFLGPSWRMSLTLLHFYCGLSVFAIICFSAASVVFSSVGTISEAVVYSVALLFAPTIIIFIVESIAGALMPSSTLGTYVTHFVETDYRYDSGTSLLEATSDYNPLLFFTNQLREFCSAVIDDGSIILSKDGKETAWHLPALFVCLPWFIIALALGVLGAFLFRRIKAENCGFLNTNKVLSNLTIFELCLIGSSVMLSEINYTEKYIVIAVGVVAAFVLYLIAEIFLKRNFVRILKSLYKFVAHMAVIAIIFTVCATDVFSYSSYIPDISKIQSVEVSVPCSYAPITTKYLGSGWNSSSFINVMESYTFSFMPEITAKEDIEKITEINRAITSDERDDGISCEIIIRYNLRNGGYSERKHILTSRNEISLLLSIMDSADVKKEITNLFYHSGGIEAVKKTNDMYGWVDDDALMALAFEYEYSEITARAASLYENKVLRLSEEQFTALKDAIYKDLMNLSAAQYFNSDARQYGVLSLGLNEKAYCIEGINGYYDMPVEDITEADTTEADTTEPDATEATISDDIHEPDVTQPEHLREEPVTHIYSYEDFYEEAYEYITEDIPAQEAEEAYEEALTDESSVYAYEYEGAYEYLGALRNRGTYYDVIITDNMVNTLSFLNSEGFADCFVSEYEIESVSFREYDCDEIFSYYSYASNSYIHDFFAYPVGQEYFDGITSDPNFNPVGTVSENIITDKEQIKELDSLMKLHEYTFDSGYFCLIKYKNGSYTTKYLSNEDAPSYVSSYNYTLNLNPLY